MREQPRNGGVWVDVPLVEDGMSKFPGWPQVRDEYLMMLSISRAPGTVNHRRQVIESYSRWHQERYNRPTCRRCDQMHVVQYFADLSKRVCQNTVHIYWHGLHHYNRWCVARGYLPDDQIALVPGPRLNRHVMAPLTDEELHILLEKADVWETAIILLGLGSGLRIGEMAALKWSDITGNHALIHGKGNKERVVPIASVALNHLKQLPRFDDPVLPYTYYGLTSKMRRLGRRCGLQGICNHVLRTTFAVKYLRAGGSFENLRLLLGHSSYAMTAHYVKASEEERMLAEAQRYNPADELLGQHKPPTGGKVVSFRRRG